MGKERPFQMVKFFCGFIYREEEMRASSQGALARLLSPPDSESEAFPFSFTRYYEAEMGQPLFRRFVSFLELRDPEELARIKVETNLLERESVAAGRRRINIDPGFLSLGNVILATTKNYAHRIPLREGIYAHLEYVFRGSRPTPLDWTYPDFRTGEYMDFFSRLRALYKRQLDEPPLGGAG